MNSILETTSVPAVLANSKNCYYLRTDGSFHIIAANTKFTEIIDASGISSNNLSEILPLRNEQQWRNLIADLQIGKSKSVSTDIGLTEECVTVLWEITACPTEKSRDITYEIIGIATNHTANRDNNKGENDRMLDSSTQEALKASEEKYRVLFQNHPLPTWIYDAETFCFLDVNEAAIKKYGYSREEFLKMSLEDILTKKDFSRFNDSQQSNDGELREVNGLWMHRTKDGAVFFAEVTAGPINYNGRKANIVLSFDRTEHTLAQQELLKSNQKYLFLSEATNDAIWDMDIKTHKVTWNHAALDMFEIEDPSTLDQPDWWSVNIHPEDKERVVAKFDEYLATGKPVWEDEYRFRTASNNYKYIHDRGYLMFDEHNQPVRMIGAMQDLTQRKGHEVMLRELNNSLEKRAKELAESNEDLERFAYVASHDLQEPLRMVTSFLQLLEKRYKDKLDKKAHEYIAYAVDGAERMKKLILDLLEYSRVNTSSVQKEEVDVAEILAQLKLTYKAVLQETKGVITYKKMPVVFANRTQLTQVFQNLIGNAFKYKSEESPLIQISCEEEKSFYRFAVTDNGIGIAPRFFGKIFIIFQRLHNREQYTGTGIGLAICKKIIDKHGGKIWVTSAPGQGSTFYFTLPKS